METVAASKDCDLEKDKGCKIVQQTKLARKIYLLEKNKNIKYHKKFITKIYAN